MKCAALRNFVRGCRRDRRAGLPVGTVVCILALVAVITLIPPRAVWSAYAQAIGPRRPRVLNSRANAVANISAWAAAVRLHVADTFDDTAVRFGEWKAEQLIDLQVELTNLLTLMDHPEQRSFVVEDQKFQQTDVLYTAKDLENLRQLARSLGGRDPDRRFEDLADSKHVVAARAHFIKRAAILHTDIARLLSGNTEGPGGSQGKQSVLKFYDGQVVGVDRSSDHWEFARNLLDRIAPARDHDVRLWYRATLTWMIGAMQLHGVHFQHAKQLYPDDAVILYLRGCFHETLASSRVQAVNINRGTAVRSVRMELNDAETYLQRAITLEPSLVEARLRLGRVESLLGKNNLAIAELQLALSLSDDQLLRYYGNLFLGSAYESASVHEQAIVAYKRASTYYPDADAPRLALSRLALSRTGQDAALTSLDPLLRRGSNVHGEDPWLSYYVAAGRTSEKELAAAYEALSKSATR